jgi:hypothetical protein
VPFAGPASRAETRHQTRLLTGAPPKLLIARLEHTAFELLVREDFACSLRRQLPGDRSQILVSAVAQELLADSGDVRYGRGPLSHGGDHLMVHTGHLGSGAFET